MSVAFLTRRFVSSVAGHLPFGVMVVWGRVDVRFRCVGATLAVARNGICRAGDRKGRPYRIARRAVGDAGPYEKGSPAICLPLAFLPVP